jgi:hypothetical protein
VFGRRRKGIRVRQKVRRLELWPLAKLALVFHAICGVISLGVLVALWKLAERADVPDRMTGFLVDIGFAESVDYTGSRLFSGATTIVFALVLHNTVVTVLLGALYNLLSGLLGGLIFSVVQDEELPRRGIRRTKPNNPSSSRQPEKVRPTKTPSKTPTKTPDKTPKGERAAAASDPTDTINLVDKPGDKTVDKPGAEDDGNDWLSALADDEHDPPWTAKRA